MNFNLVQNLNPASFWFYISSFYFPYCFNEFLKAPESYIDVIVKIIDNAVTSKTIVKKNYSAASKKRLLYDLASVVSEENILELPLNEKNENYLLDLNSSKKEMSIDTIIGNFQDYSNELQKRNQTFLKSLLSKLNIRNSIEEENKGQYQYDPDDILTDMKYRSSCMNLYKTWLIKKHEEKASEANHNVLMSRIEEECLNNNPDDIVCYICNDGDYEDNDLIVYCSLCQMTVHQNCYDIVDIPEEDWICYNCMCFGCEEGKMVECCLCPVVGGAMKPSTLKKNSNFYNAIMNYRLKNSNNINNFSYNNSIINSIITVEIPKNGYINDRKDNCKTFFKDKLKERDLNGINDTFSNEDTIITEKIKISNSIFSIEHPETENKSKLTYLKNSK